MADHSEIITFTLTPDNPCNTTITNASGEVLYVVYTESDQNASTTRVYEGKSDTVVAALLWSDTGLVLGKVTLRGEKEVPMREWMSKSMMPFNDAAFKDKSGRRYKWKGLSAGRALELYAEDDGYKQPVAGFHKSIVDRRVSPPGVIPATLRLAPRADEIRELLVCSFLFLENDRRAKEKSFGDMRLRMAGQFAMR
ncbi:uncharacterized protein C8Q71DRAFT_861669 [Rhodofomes roseus]|uniref:DUF6593 domain-containing protein n=1 Tax=Rhodofomes roseus TaxID=34475 RepID=A0ABQ8K4Q7_9APHY|nr:uncharacterized protein C8Q71DRAFT_861669 [Rhodofomes roseus]KAH9831664.1 hypothetical protein C8Q71DRAFT_861669 [Rhodofomes roseus]